MLAVKRLASVAPEVHLREDTLHLPPQYEGTTHSGCETQRRCHQKSKTVDFTSDPKIGHVYVKIIFVNKDALTWLC